jgi:hypothetical protein
MTIFYIHPESGNDAAPGTSWAEAWQSMDLGATAARIAPGDTIKIAKSPDPTGIGNATWNNLSKVVTLESALTLNVDLCNAVWSYAANVSGSISTTARKEGTHNVQLNIADAFTTGKVAYKSIGGAVDYSAFQKLSFQLRTSAVIAGGVFKLCLCSDASGDTIVDEFFLPGVSAAYINLFFPVTVNKGSALGASIQSVALYAVSDPGVVSVSLDNVLACNDLSLTSVISKNALAAGGAEGWYPVQSINGTVIFLDNGPQTIASAGRGYFGITETVATYQRQGFRTVRATECAVQDSGVAGALISFQGGYDPATGLQDGETFYDFGAGPYGTGLVLSERSFVLANRVNPVRGSTGFRMGASCQVYAQTVAGSVAYGVELYAKIGNLIDIKNVINNATGGITATYWSTGNDLVLGNVNNNIQYGVYLEEVCWNFLFAENICNNGSTNLHFHRTSGENTLRVANVKNSGNYGLYMGGEVINNTLYDAEFAGNASGGISAADFSTAAYLKRCTFLDSVPFVFSLTKYADTRLYCERVGGDIQDNRIYMDGGQVLSQTAIRQSNAPGIAWRLSPTHAIRGSYWMPVSLSLAKIPVYANKIVSITCWFMRDNVALSGRLFIQGRCIDGIGDADLVDDVTADAGVWEQLSLSFTPTESAVVEVMAQACGGTTYSLYVDNIHYSQAA